MEQIKYFKKSWLKYFINLIKNYKQIDPRSSMYPKYKKHEDTIPRYNKATYNQII